MSRASVDGQWAPVDRSWARWRSGAVGVAAAAWLFLRLREVVEQGLAGAAWVRVLLFVGFVLLCAALLIRAVHVPRPLDAMPVADRGGGWGVDGPERRRMRRALREGTPLRSGDRDRALLRARRSLSRATRRGTSAHERSWSAGLVAYLFALLIRESPSWAAPTFETSDLKTAGQVVVVLAIVGLISWCGLPGRRFRERRARQRVEALENHPVAE